MKVLICDSPTIRKNDTISCNSWQVVDYKSLALKEDIIPFEQYLGFDTQIFFIVIGALLLSFITGHIGGVVVRHMNRV